MSSQQWYRTKLCPQDHRQTYSPTVLLSVRAIPMQRQLKLISLTCPSFKQLITHRHTITAFTAQSSPDGGIESKTEGGKSGTERLEQAQRNRESRGHTEEHRKQSEKEKGKESGGFNTSKPWTSILLEYKLIFPLTYSSGLAPSQNLSEKLFVSGIPNTGINVMLMTF